MDHAESPMIAICCRDNLMRDGLSRLLADTFHVLASVDAVDHPDLGTIANRLSILICCSSIDVVGLILLKQRCPTVNVVVIVSQYDKWNVEISELDVKGVLRSSISKEVLITCLDLVLQGERVFSFPTTSGDSKITIVTERRSLMRVGSSVRGEILVDGAAPIACIIRNVSLQGAKIEAAATAIIPNQFFLLAPELNLSTQAKIVWRSSTEVGVMFPSPSSAGSQSVS